MYLRGWGMEDFAREAYQKPTDRSLTVEGHVYDPELSNEDVATYKDKDDKYVVAFRGTSKIRDLHPDIGIALNRFKDTDRYKNDKKQLQKVIDRAGGVNNVKLSGHSLGGTSAATLGREFGITTETYNTGSTPLQMSNDLISRLSCMVAPNRKDCKNAQKVTHNLIVGDPISQWAIFRPNVKYHKQKKFNPHLLSNFD